MSEQFKEYEQNENLKPKCDICGGVHKTSSHEEYVVGKKEFMNIICEICKGLHKTSQHHDKEDFVEKDKDRSEYFKEPTFRGQDGEEYPDRLSRERADEAWRRKTTPYKGDDGQYYEDHFALEEANRRFREQMNPKKEEKDF